MEDSKKEFVIYSNDAELRKKMYFTGTEWGGPGYFNQLSGAYRFDNKAEAEEARDWLDDALVVPQEHFIQEVTNEKANI